jgi:hypothetical protein
VTSCEDEGLPRLFQERDERVEGLTIHWTARVGMRLIKPTDGKQGHLWGEAHLLARCEVGDVSHVEIM